MGSFWLGIGAGLFAAYELIIRTVHHELVPAGHMWPYTLMALGAAIVIVFVSGVLPLIFFMLDRIGATGAFIAAVISVFNGSPAAILPLLILAVGGVFGQELARQVARRNNTQRPIAMG